MGLEPPKPEASAPAAPATSAPPPPVSATAGDLPDFAKKADDLEAIKQAVDDAASVGGALWLSYLGFLFYLAIAAGAVTHTDLFLENPVKLPFLNVDLPLLAFFFLAPILFLVVHAYTLVHLVMLTDKAKRFDAALRDQIGDENAAVRESLRRQLPSNIFIQFLAGAADIRERGFGLLLRAIAWTTLVIAPVLLLLLMQIQFLPFHNSFITWTHRFALLADLVLIWWLWRKILAGRETETRRDRTAWTWRALGLVLSAGAVLFSWTAATFPGEWQEEHWPEWRFLPALTEWGHPETEKDSAAGNLRTASFQDWAIKARRLSLHDWLFNERPDNVSRRRFPFSNTLVLTGLNIYEGLGIDDPDKAKFRDFIFRARGRDLRGTQFDFATLAKVDFEGADLQGASLSQARLEHVSFDGASLQGASFDFAQLQATSFGCGQYNDLRCAQLQGASLDHARLQGESLDNAQLTGASLVGAQLQGASLDGAQLRGAVLQSAELQGASLDGADLQGASLYGAQLQGASLDASFEDRLESALTVGGRPLQGAALEVTDLSFAYLWRADRQAQPAASAVRTLGDLLWNLWMPVWQDESGEHSPWNEKAYQALLSDIESLPPGELRKNALERIKVLDCTNSDPALASCDRNIPPPTQAAAWRKTLEAASVDDKTYTTALAKVLRGLVCSGKDDAIYVVRGLGFQTRLEDAGAAAKGLIDDLMNKDGKDCPVSPALTDADRAKLLQIKQGIEKAGKS